MVALLVQPISGTRRRASGCNTPPLTTDRSSAWLERCVWDAEVAGSNPVGPTTSNRNPFGSDVEGIFYFLGQVCWDLELDQDRGVRLMCHLVTYDRSGLNLDPRQDLFGRKNGDVSAAGRGEMFQVSGN